MPIFAATSAADRVLLTSPTTETRSGFSLENTFSSSSIILAVCSAWLPEPIPRWTSGAGMPRSVKKTSLIFTS